MDIGTGKDMADYWVEGKQIPVHLTDIVDAGSQYNVFEYQRDFLIVWKDLQQRHKFPVLCGGSGLYLEAVLENYRLVQVPINEPLRSELAGKSLEELTLILKSYNPKLHNITDIVNEKRAVRAIEIAEYQQREGERRPITDHRLPNTDYRSPITEYRIPNTEHRTPPYESPDRRHPFRPGNQKGTHHPKVTSAAAGRND